MDFFDKIDELEGRARRTVDGLVLKGTIKFDEVTDRVSAIVADVKPEVTDRLDAAVVTANATVEKVRARIEDATLSPEERESQIDKAIALAVEGALADAGAEAGRVADAAKKDKDAAVEQERVRGQIEQIAAVTAEMVRGQRAQDAAVAAVKTEDKTTLEKTVQALNLQHDNETAQIRSQAQAEARRVAAAAKKDKETAVNAVETKAQTDAEKAATAAQTAQDKAVKAAVAATTKTLNAQHGDEMADLKDQHAEAIESTKATVTKEVTAAVTADVTAKATAALQGQGRVAKRFSREAGKTIAGLSAPSA